MVAELQKKANATIQAVTLRGFMKARPEFDPKKLQDELKGKVMDAAKDATLDRLVDAGDLADMESS